MQTRAAAKHTDAIDWPNGEGFTPCTPEYADTMAKRDAIYCTNDRVNGLDSRTLDDLSPEDYEAWMRLDGELLSMQANGHLGESIRY